MEGRNGEVLSLVQGCEVDLVTEVFSYEVRLSELRLFRLEKRRLGVEEGSY